MGNADPNDPLYGTNGGYADWTPKNGYFIPPPPGQTYNANPVEWGGHGQTVTNINGTLGYINGTSGAEEDVNRYQNMGNAALMNYNPDIDYSGAQRFTNAAVDAQGMGYGARGAQTDSLALARAAAMGQAPSQAEMLSRNMLGQSLQSQLAGAASARGGSMAQAAAMRQASLGAAAFQQQGMNSIGAMRAQEMAAAREQYGQQAYGIRGQDYALAGQNIQQSAQAAQQSQFQSAQDMQQRQMNQQAQQYYENMAWNTKNAELSAHLGTAAQTQQQQQFNAQMQQQQDQLYAQEASAVVNGVATGGAGVLTAYAASQAGNGGGGGGRGGGSGPWTEGYADGGPVAPGQTILVGEQGPEVIVPAQQAPAQPLPLDRGTSAVQNGTTLSQLASTIAGVAPGPAVLYSGAGLGAQAQGFMTRAQDDAARAAQAEQKAQDDERAAMQAAERVQAMPAPAHTQANTVTALPDAEVARRIQGEGPMSWQARWAGLINPATAINHLLKRADGGPIPPGQPVLVGEQGPEVVQMQQPGMVLPATHPISQQVAQKQMTLADVAKLRQQADELERNLDRQKRQGPAVGTRQINMAPVIINDAPEPRPTLAQVARSRPQSPYTAPAAPPLAPARPMGGTPAPPTLAQAAMMGSPLATNRNDLMGGREDPYMNYSAPTWGTGRQQPILDRGLMGGRADPYMADAALALEQYR